MGFFVWFWVLGFLGIFVIVVVWVFNKVKKDSSLKARRDSFHMCVRGNREASKQSMGGYITVIDGREYKINLDCVNVSQKNKCV